MRNETRRKTNDLLDELEELGWDVRHFDVDESNRPYLRPEDDYDQPFLPVSVSLDMNGEIPIEEDAPTS